MIEQITKRLNKNTILKYGLVFATDKDVRRMMMWNDQKKFMESKFGKHPALENVDYVYGNGFTAYAVFLDNRLIDGKYPSFTGDNLFEHLLLHLTYEKIGSSFYLKDWYADVNSPTKGGEPLSGVVRLCNECRYVYGIPLNEMPPKTATVKDILGAPFTEEMRGYNISKPKTKDVLPRLNVRSMF